MFRATPALRYAQRNCMLKAPQGCLPPLGRRRIRTCSRCGRQSQRGTLTERLAPRATRAAGCRQPSSRSYVRPYCGWSSVVSNAPTRQTLSVRAVARPSVGDLRNSWSVSGSKLACPELCSGSLLTKTLSKCKLEAAADAQGWCENDSDEPDAIQSKVPRPSPNLRTKILLPPLDVLVAY